MFPILLELGGFKLQAYGVFVALGYVAALLLARWLANSRGYSPAIFSNLCFFCLVFGLIGGRILFLIVNFSYYRENPNETLNPWSGGLVFFGGFFLAVLFSFFYFRRKKIPVWTGFDILAPALALGHSVGRLGCFFAGCCHGSACAYPWAMKFHSDLVAIKLRNIPIHPTQLYESFGLALICILLIALHKKKAPTGLVSALYLMVYSGLRFVIEFFRGDEIRGISDLIALSTSQIIAPILFFFGGWLLIRSLRSDH